MPATAPQVITTPSGDRLVVIPAAEYEALQDAADAAGHAAEMARLARGETETVTAAEAAELLASVTPLAFWRRKRGMTQRALADAAGISQGYVADIEAGRRQGDVSVLLRIARALRLRIEDLVIDPDGEPVGT